MAGITLSGLSAILNLMYGGGITATLRRDTVLPHLIPTVFEANPACQWQVKVGARNTAGPRAQGADASGGDYSTDTKLGATIAWAHYESFASITGTAQRIAAANPGFNAGIGGGGEFDREMADASDELAVAISEDSYSGDYTATPVEIAGLAAAIDSTGTYAGIAQGSYSTWASGEASLATSALSVASLRQYLFRPVKNATGRKPSVVFCPGDVMDSIKSLADNSGVLQNIVTPQMGVVNIANLGFEGVMIDGVPFVEDRHCTSSTLYAVDLSQLEYVQVPPDWLNVDPGQLQGMLKELMGQNIPLDQIASAINGVRTGRQLVAQVNALAKSGDSTKVQLVLDMQLRLRRRNAAAKLALT